MRNLLVLLVTVLAFNLSNAQETYTYKISGKEINYKFTDSLLTTLTYDGEIQEIKVRLVDKNENVTVYYTTESYMGAKSKWSLVHIKKDKYAMMISAVDDFTGEITKFNLNVIKI